MTVDIGRFQKAIAFLKTLGAHNMVVIHALSMWQPGIKTPSSWYFETSALRGVTTMMFPFFAGFYIRSELGPFLDTPKFSQLFLSRGLKFFCLASVIEGLRLLLMTFDFRYCLNLHVLQFVALSSILTYFLLRISKWALPLVAVSFLLAQSNLENLVSFLQLQQLPQDQGLLRMISWGWTFYFIFLILGAVYSFIDPKKIRRPKLLSVTCLMISLLFLSLAPDLVLQTPRALLSFVNIPHDLLAPNLQTDNYWHLIPFFPVFYFGYLTRSMIFRNFVPWKFVTIITLFVGIAFYYLFRVHPGFVARIDNTYIYSKALFAFKPMEVIGFSGLFGLSVGLVYAGFKYIQWKWIDRWLYYSRSALMIYIVHGFFIALVLRIINPQEFFGVFKSTDVRHLVFVALVMAVYLVSLFFANLGILIFKLARLDGA